MSTTFRGLFFLFLLHAFLLSGCGSETNNAPTFPVVVFSDLHFNPFYDPSLVQKLVATDADQWETVFKTSHVSVPAAGGEDTNYPLLVLALSSIRDNRGTSPLMIYTGDLLGHGIPQYFYKYLNGTASPRNLDDVAAMKGFTNKALLFVMQQVRTAAGNIPVMFAVGNGDSYSGYGPNSADSSFSPASSFLSDTAELFYTKLLNGAADHQAFLDGFTRGGYYSAEPSGTNLMVIGLNTIMFSPLVTVSADLVNAELAWLDARLAAARDSGKKVWLLMHVPPGADTTSTARLVDSSGQIAKGTMMWKPEYQAAFLQTIVKYPGTVTLSLAGHTHMDEYRIMSAGNLLDVTPSISPCFKNNPAYKLFTFSRETLKPTDYVALNYDLATLPGEFQGYYSFSAAYALPPVLDASLAQLFPTLATDSSKQALYRGYYFSGNNAANPISDANWPVFRCGIGNMEQQQFLDCVNSH